MSAGGCTALHFQNRSRAGDVTNSLVCGELGFINIDNVNPKAGTDHTVLNNGIEH